MNTLGRHLLIELYDCDIALLNDAEKIKSILISAAKNAGCSVVSAHSNLFNPHGVSAVVVIAESHITIHTWPELGYASIDAYTCSGTVNPWKIRDFLIKSFKAGREESIELERGLFGKAKVAQIHGQQFAGNKEKDSK